VIDRLVLMFEASNPRSVQDLAAERDALLVDLLEVLSEARHRREQPS
jgi:hypothetical protein